MRTPVFELHIRPLFRMTDHEHMRVQVDLWDYDQVAANAERILGHEPQDAAVAGGAQPFSLEELFQGPETQSIDVPDSTGVHHVR
jgi:hypothetical protein